MLSAASQPMGSAIRSTRASADAIHTGSARSRPWNRTTLMPRSRAEELHEAVLDLLVAFLELLRLHREELELRELGLVARVLHLGVPGVESLAVGHHLLQLAAEREVGEEPRCRRMGREARDRGGGHHQR